MKKAMVVVLLMIMVLTLGPAQAKAQQNDMKEVLESSFYGGLTGALIGGAFLAFRDKPGDHLKDLRIGAAAGVIAGTIYGLARTTRAFAEVTDGKLAFRIPTIQFDVDRSDKAVRASLELIQIPFQ